MSRRADLQRAIAREMESLGVRDWHFENARGKGHPRVVFIVNGHCLTKTYAGSPSEKFFTERKLLADIRRMARTATVETPSIVDEKSGTPDSRPLRRRERRRARRLPEIPYVRPRPDPWAALAVLLPVNQRKES